MSLSIKARREVFASMTSELLFFRGPECTTMNQFMKCYQEHFGVPLMIEELSAETLETLSETNELGPFVKVEKGGRKERERASEENKREFHVISNISFIFCRSLLFLSLISHLLLRACSVSNCAIS